MAGRPHPTFSARSLTACVQLINVYAELGAVLQKTSVAIAEFNKVLAVTADPKEQAILMANAPMNLPYFAAVAPANGAADEASLSPALSCGRTHPSTGRARVRAAGLAGAGPGCTTRARALPVASADGSHLLSARPTARRARRRRRRRRSR